MKRSIAVVAMLVVGFAATTCAQTGREIAQKVKDRPDGDTRRSEMVMTLINKRGAVRERKLISYSIDVGKEKKDRKSIMFFQYPGDVKGTGFLTWDYDELNKDDDKWLYLPAIKKTRRISGSSAKQDYFMGMRLYLRRHGQPQRGRGYAHAPGRRNRRRTEVLETGILA